MGGGVGLSVHGKYKVATQNTVFAMPETGIGFFCDVGGSHFLPRLPSNIGVYLALTGARLKGNQLITAGIASHFISAELLPELESRIAGITSPEQIEHVLNSYHKNTDNAQIPHLEDINDCFGRSSVEDIWEALENHKSEWSKSQLETLSKMSPTSLKVVFSQIKRGSKLNLGECFKMEYRMSQQFMKQNDFREGVRALLVDKDKNPRWKPATIKEVTDTMVEEYFKPLSPEHELPIEDRHYSKL
eukprot:TRINITY_DN4323_c0_g1_i1.p1 TRINITY_DN4323_c0_g1~~TRINITY_DN4323_c0_g1_i1.p1  ORF type:complete len:265 (-),score=37.26 TRINITY_DN4323_c0_g1_i1:3-737(-)